MELKVINMEDIEKIKGKYHLPEADQEQFNEAIINLLKVTLNIAQNKATIKIGKEDKVNTVEFAFNIMALVNQASNLLNQKALEATTLILDDLQNEQQLIGQAK